MGLPRPLSPHPPWNNAHSGLQAHSPTGAPSFYSEAPWGIGGSPPMETPFVFVPHDCHKAEDFSVASMPWSLWISWNMPEGPQDNLTTQLARVMCGLCRAWGDCRLGPDGVPVAKSVWELKSALLVTSSHTRDPAATVIFLNYKIHIKIAILTIFKCTVRLR